MRPPRARFGAQPPDVVEADAAFRQGVVDATYAYVAKPLTVAALTRKVREVLDAGGPADGAV